jgi:hypothetical protein
MLFSKSRGKTFHFSKTILHIHLFNSNQSTSSGLLALALIIELVPEKPEAISFGFG